MKNKHISSENNLNNLSKKNILLFVLPSLVGLLLFIVPIKIDNSVTLIVAVFAKYLEQLLLNQLSAISSFLIIISAILTLLSSKIQNKKSYAAKLFCLSNFWKIVRTISAILVVLTYFKIGPQAIISNKTGGYILNDLLGLLFCVFLFAGLLLPLLLNYGLLEFCGILFAKFMRPLFTLPGRASIDCLASFLGDGTIGVLLTNKQYEQGYYTQREAAVIGTTFSLVSVTFTIVILSIAKLNDYIAPYYAAILLSTLATAFICPRIPPLSQKKDIYIKNAPKHNNKETVPTGYSRLAWAFRKACKTSNNNKSFLSFIIEGLKNVLDMWLGVLPIVMCFGTSALIIAEYTEIFKWLGTPFIPLLKLLSIPEAEAASQSVVIGFADMFLPVTLISDVNNEMTRFVIACLSVSQLIFMSEVGSLLLGSTIPVNFKDLCWIFLQRTLISLPIISLVAHLVF